MTRDSRVWMGCSDAVTYIFGHFSAQQLKQLAYFSATNKFCKSQVSTISELVFSQLKVNILTNCRLTVRLYPDPQ